MSVHGLLLVLWDRVAAVVVHRAEVQSLSLVLHGLGIIEVIKPGCYLVFVDLGFLFMRLFFNLRVFLYQRLFNLFFLQRRWLWRLRGSHGRNGYLIRRSVSSLDIDDLWLRRLNVDDLRLDLRRNILRIRLWRLYLYIHALVFLNCNVIREDVIFLFFPVHVLDLENLSHACTLGLFPVSLYLFCCLTLLTVVSLYVGNPVCY